MTGIGRPRETIASFPRPGLHDASCACVLPRAAETRRHAARRTRTRRHEGRAEGTMRSSLVACRCPSSEPGGTVMLRSQRLLLLRYADCRIMVEPAGESA